MTSSPYGSRRRPSKRSGCGCLGGLLLFTAVLVVPSVVLDFSGETAAGRVTRKHEDVRITSDGGWQRTLQVAVATARSDATGLQPMVGVDQARFDRMRVGDSVRVRYVECCPIFARLADRTTLDWVRDITPDTVYELRWVAWLIGGLGFLVFAGRYGVGYLLAAALACGAAALALDRGTRRPTPTDGTARAQAEVRDVRRIEYALATRRSSDFELRLPYDVAVLAFVPTAGADTVVAVDAVDAESVRGLAPGATVRVRFDSAAPRAATIEGGAHLLRGEPPALHRDRRRHLRRRDTHRRARLVEDGAPPTSVDRGGRRAVAL